jgi:hypothetical protein
MMLYVKMILLVQVGACWQCFRLSGQRWIDKLGEVSYFRVDLLLGLLAVPVGLLLLQRLVGPRAGLAVTAALSGATYAVLFAQLQSLESVGAFVPLGLLRDALAWAWENPRQTGAYVGPQDRLLLAAGLACVACAAWWSARRLRAGTAERPPRFASWGRRIGAALVAAIVILSWTVRGAATPYHRSALSWTLFPSSHRRTVPLDEFSRLTPNALLNRYRALTGAPVPSRDARYWGTMAGADVIFFVFETGPAACLDVAGDLGAFPTLRRLRDRAFVAARHYSTSPLTNRALFSIFTSTYPSTFNFDVAFERAPLAGVVGHAAAAGYETALYMRAEPGRLVPGDTERMRAIGFERLRYPEARGAPPDVAAEITLETGTLALFKEDLARWARDGRRFVAGLLPLIGHAPWPDTTGGRARTLVERGRALMAIQDAWLGELLAELERHGRLDRTVIVITADHGIRTRKEDPDFRLGMIDEYTFHVPLLIHAPGTLDAPVVVPWVTSHVDVSPTVLDLLGLERDRDGEQGTAMWNEGIAGRTTFQLASLFLGSDGLSGGGRFSMYGYLTDTVYQGPRMRFAPEHALPAGTPEAVDVIRTLERINALQTAWTIRQPRASPAGTD